MSNWEKLAVEEFADVISGATPDTSIAKLWNGKINWITPVDLSKLSTRFIFSSLRKISVEGLNSCATTILPAGSVVMSSRAPIGYFAIGQTDFTTNQGCKSFLFKKKHDSEFHYYSFSFNVEKFKQLGAGSTFAEISKAQIEKIVFDVPPLPEQQKIAKILRTVDGQIEKTEAIIAKYRAIKQGLRQDLFTRGIDVATGRPRPRYQDAPELYKSSPLGMIPKEWDMVGLGNKDLFDLKTGGTPSTVIPSFWNGNIPWLSSGEVHYKRVKGTIQRITTLGYECSNAVFYPKQSILIALAGQGKTRGTVAITEIELTSNQSVAAVIPNKQLVNPLFIYHLLDSQYEELRAASAGAGRAGLNLTILGQYNVIYPPKKEQDEIAIRFEAIDKTLSIENGKLSKLTLLKKGLMSDLLSRKVRVQVDEEAVC